MARLFIKFTPTNNPSKGFIVKYRQVNTLEYTTITPNPASSPIEINNLGAGVGYEGTIQADCGNGQYGVIVPFTANVAAKFNMARDPSSATNACGLTNFNYTFYASVALLQVNTQLYADDLLGEVYTTGGYYSNGTTVYQVSSLGVVLSIAACPINP